MKNIRKAITESVINRGATDAVLAVKQPSNHSLMHYRMLMALVVQHQILADYYDQAGKHADSTRHQKFASQFRSEALRAKPQ